MEYYAEREKAVRWAGRLQADLTERCPLVLWRGEVEETPQLSGVPRFDVVVRYTVKVEGQRFSGLSMFSLILLEDAKFDPATYVAEAIALELARAILAWRPAEGVAK